MPKTSTNDTINLFFKLQSAISNHNSFRVQFDKIEKKYLYFSIGNGQSREPALCQLCRHTFVPYIARLTFRLGVTSVPVLNYASSFLVACHPGTRDVRLSSSSTICYRQEAVMSCGWEGNRRSGRASQTSLDRPPTGCRLREGRLAPRLHSSWPVVDV